MYIKYSVFAQRICASKIIALSVNKDSDMSSFEFQEFLDILAQSQLTSLELMWLPTERDPMLPKERIPVYVSPVVYDCLKNLVERRDTLKELGLGHLAPEVSEHPAAARISSEWLEFKRLANTSGVRIAQHARRTHWHLGR